MEIYPYKTTSILRTFARGRIWQGATVISALAFLFCLTCRAEKQTGQRLDASIISEAAGTKVSIIDDGIIRIGWSRDDVVVEVDGMVFPPVAGLGSWAAFTPTENGRWTRRLPTDF